MIQISRVQNGYLIEVLKHDSSVTMIVVEDMAYGDDTAKRIGEIIMLNLTKEVIDDDDQS